MDLDRSHRQRKAGLHLEPYAKRKSSRIILKPIGFVGLGVFYVAVAGQGVPHLASLGLSESQISLALISGPLCGAVLQPVFGSWSDRYHSSWGRRKPFIVFGAIWLIASTLCLAWARSIIALLISDIATQETQDTLLSSFSILTVFSMYAAVQAVQIGMRALIIDGCSLPEQAEANAWAGRYIGVGGVLGNLAALLDDLSRQVERDNCRTILMDMSIFTAFCLLPSLLVSCSFTSRDGNALDVVSPPKVKSGGHATGRRWNLLKGSSIQFRMICLVQFFSWLGWFPFYFYTVTYVNGLSEAQHSESLPNEPKKREWENEAAPRLGSFTFFTYSLVSLIVAMLLPYLTPSQTSSPAAWLKKPGKQSSLFTMPRLWMLSHAVFGCCMLGTFVVTSASGTVILFTIVGFSWAASNWIPYALLGAEIARNSIRHARGSGYSDDDAGAAQHSAGSSADAGLIYGLHGLAICVPQILMALLMGAVSLHTDRGPTATGRNLQIVWMFRAGGLFAFIAMFCTMWVKDLDEEGRDSSSSNSLELDEACEVLLSDER